MQSIFPQISPSGSRRASSLPPPPTSPKKGVFEGFEQFVKVATLRASSDVSRRASSDVTSDVSRRSSDVTSPPDLLNGENDECAPPIVVEISPRGPKAVAPGGLLDAEFAPGTWALGGDWADVCSPPGGAGTGPAFPRDTESMGSPPTRPVLSAAIPGQSQPNGGLGTVPSFSGSPDVSSTQSKVPNPILRGRITPGVNSQPVSPAGNPFRAQYPDPFLAAFGESPGQNPIRGGPPQETLSTSKSLNPFLEEQAENNRGFQQSRAPIYEGLPNPFALNHADQTWTPQKPSNSTASEIKFPSTANREEGVFTATVSAQVTNPFLKPKSLSSQNGALLRSQTQAPPRKEAAWETFSTGNPFPTQAVNPGLTRSVTAPPTAFSNNSTARTGPLGIGISEAGWEPFHTGPLQAGTVGVNAAPIVAPVAPVSGAKAGDKAETIPDEWESFGRQRNLSSKARPHVV